MRRFIVSVAVGLIAACSATTVEPLPEIADKLPSDVRDAQPEFDRRVKVAFPVGSDENAAISKLKHAGFKVSSLSPDGYRSADIERGNAVCKTLWSVRWKAEVGVLREMFGVYGHRCP